VSSDIEVAQCLGDGMYDWLIEYRSKSKVFDAAQIWFCRAPKHDPVLKERYEDLAVDLARNAGREQDLDSPESDDTSSHSGA